MRAAAVAGEQLVQISQRKFGHAQLKQVLATQCHNTSWSIGFASLTPLLQRVLGTLDSRDSFGQGLVIKTTAAAPSDIEEEFAAVTVPSFLNAGRSPGIFSILQRGGSSS